jgi:hypothetical protein
MNGTLTTEGEQALFENAPEPPSGFVLWHKDNRPRAAWEMLGTFATHYQAVCAMRGKGRFLILESGREP